MTLENTRIQLGLFADLVSALDLANARVPLAVNYQQSFSSGSGAGQVDLIWHDRRTLAPSATENLDFAGVLTDPFGAALTFARIKALLIVAAAGNTHNVNVTRPAVNGVPLFLAASDGMPVHAGGPLFWADPGAAGVVVTAATGDLLTVTNAGAVSAVTYDIAVLGGSA